MVAKRVLLTSVFIFFCAGAATAADLPRQVPIVKAPVMVASPWFLDAGIGAGFERVDTLHFVNPLGIPFTSNPTSGNEILLNNIKRTDTSLTGTAGLGYFLNSNWYVKGEYRYFGRYKSSGFATFGGVAFLQEMKSTIHGALFDVGYVHDIAPQLYLDASVGIGAAFINSTGTQGANINFGGFFPSRSQVNFVAGGALGLGWRLTASTALTVTGSYHYIGNVSTGVHPGSAIQNAGEQLFVRDMGIASAVVGVRQRF